MCLWECDCCVGVLLKVGFYIVGDCDCCGIDVVIG